MKNKATDFAWELAKQLSLRIAYKKGNKKILEKNMHSDAICLIAGKSEP